MDGDPDRSAAALTLAEASGLLAEHPRAALLAALEAQLARTASEEADLASHAAGLHARDYALASLAAAGDDAAAERVYTEHEPTVLRAVRSARVAPSLADDVLAKVWERVLVAGEGGATPAIGTYSGKGALGAWLHVSVVREAHHASRAAARFVGEPEDAEAEARLGELGSGELEYMKGLYAEAFGRAFRDALAALDPRLRSVLRSTYVDSVSADKLAKLYGVHRVTVARWLGEARLTLAEDTRRRMALELTLPTAESESILRLIRSRLDISLRALDTGAFEAKT